MRTILRKFHIVAIIGLAAIFLTSCDGSTTIYGIEHTNRKHKKYKKQKRYPKYDVYYGNHNSLPPGQHKKIHGDKSAKKYAPGQQKKHKNKGHKRH